MTRRCIGIFSSIHFVLKAEKTLKKKGIEVDTVPVPRQISSDCGIAVSFHADDVKKVREFLKEGNCRLEGIYVETGEGTYSVVD